MMLDDNKKAWETYPNGAGIGVRGYGPSREEAFARAALALTSAVTDPAKVRALKGPIFINCRAQDDESLLTDWLDALIVKMSDRDMLFSRFDLSIRGDRLAARLWGEPVQPRHHKPALEVKSVVHDMPNVRRGEDGNWTAECVVSV